MSKLTVEEINQYIKDVDSNLISDTWHTFGELYEFRKMYNACLFNEWANEYWKTSIVSAQDPLRSKSLKYKVHKSWKHNDGEWCFGTEKKWFIVSAMLPTGLISNHYKAEDWDLFQVPEVKQALFEYDGHTGLDVLQRLKDLCSK